MTQLCSGAISMLILFVTSSASVIAQDLTFHSTLIVSVSNSGDITINEVDENITEIWNFPDVFGTPNHPSDWIIPDPRVISTSPDGNFISFSANNLENDTHLFIYDRETTELREIEIENNLNLIYFRPIQWSPDGEQLAIMTVDRVNNINELFIYILSDSRLRLVNSTTSIFAPFKWSSNETIVYTDEFPCVQEFPTCYGGENIFEVNVADNEVTQLSDLTVTPQADKWMEKTETTNMGGWDSICDLMNVRNNVHFVIGCNVSESYLFSANKQQVAVDFDSAKFAPSFDSSHIITVHVSESTGSTYMTVSVIEIDENGDEIDTLYLIESDNDGWNILFKKKYR